MLTKEQKKKHVELGAELAKNSQALIFADFSGTKTEEIKRLKKELRKLDAQFKVFKKRLLKFALQSSNVAFDPALFKTQIATIFSKKELTAIASAVYKFAKELSKTNKSFGILGAYDAAEKSFLDANQFAALAKLPPREVLLAQLVGVLSGPVRAFLCVLDQLSKKDLGASSATASQTVETKTEESKTN